MIQHLTAVQFARFMQSGRTSPALCACEDDSGTSAGEYVVKLRGSLLERGLLAELVGAKVAAHFGLSSPTPALISLEQALAELISNAVPTNADIVRDSVGLNFGTQALVGFGTWPVDKEIPSAMREVAVDIFAFDALVQNPDRTHSNPNLLTRGDSIMIFDHEVAFSFLLEIFPSNSPWNLHQQGYLADHVFYRQLRSKPLDLGRFMEKLAKLSNEVIGDIFADVPPEWNNENSARIIQHLSLVRDHAEEFADEIRRFLI